MKISKNLDHLKFVVATNTVLQLTSDELNRGINASSGNHGAALSMAVSRLGIKPKIVMPRNT